MSRQRPPKPSDRPDEVLLVTISRVRYYKPQGKDFFIIASTDLCPIKGTLAWLPQPGERLRLTGKFTAYNGEKQFAFSAAIPNIPTDMHGKLEYVVELTPGMGPALLGELWEAKGESWESVEDGEVPRLSGNLYARFRQTLAELSANGAKLQAIAYLLGKGCTQKMASAAWEKWGEKTIGVVESDCYRLAELTHYGFCHIDRDVRHHFAIGDMDPRRIRAALDYSLQKICQETGNTAAEWGAVCTESVNCLRGITRSTLAAFAGELLRTGEWSGWSDTQFISRGTMYDAEMQIWSYCKGGC